MSKENKLDNENDESTSFGRVYRGNFANLIKQHDEDLEELLAKNWTKLGLTDKELKIIKSKFNPKPTFEDEDPQKLDPRWARAFLDELDEEKRKKLFTPAPELQTAINALTRNISEEMRKEGMNYQDLTPDDKGAFKIDTNDTHNPLELTKDENGLYPIPTQLAEGQGPLTLSFAHVRSDTKNNMSKSNAVYDLFVYDESGKLVDIITPKGQVLDRGVECHSKVSNFKELREQLAKNRGFDDLDISKDGATLGGGSAPNLSVDVVTQQGGSNLDGENFKKMSNDEAAIKIQALVRGWHVRNAAEQQKIENAATTIQKVVRGRHARTKKDLTSITEVTVSTDPSNPIAGPNVVTANTTLLKHANMPFNTQLNSSSSISTDNLSVQSAKISAAVEGKNVEIMNKEPNTKTVPPSENRDDTLTNNRGNKGADLKKSNTSSFSLQKLLSSLTSEDLSNVRKILDEDQKEKIDSYITLSQEWKKSDKSDDQMKKKLETSISDFVKELPKIAPEKLIQLNPIVVNKVISFLSSKTDPDTSKVKISVEVTKNTKNIKSDPGQNQNNNSSERGGDQANPNKPSKSKSKPKVGPLDFAKLSDKEEDLSNQVTERERYNSGGDETSRVDSKVVSENSVESRSNNVSSDSQVNAAVLELERSGPDKKGDSKVDGRESVEEGPEVKGGDNTPSSSKAKTTGLSKNLNTSSTISEESIPRLSTATSESGLTQNGATKTSAAPPAAPVDNTPPSSPRGSDNNVVAPVAEGVKPSIDNVDETTRSKSGPGNVQNETAVTQWTTTTQDRAVTNSSNVNQQISVSDNTENLNVSREQNTSLRSSGGGNTPFSVELNTSFTAAKASNDTSPSIGGIDAFSRNPGNFSSRLRPNKTILVTPAEPSSVQALYNNATVYRGGVDTTRYKNYNVIAPYPEKEFSPANLKKTSTPSKPSAGELVDPSTLGKGNEEQDTTNANSTPRLAWRDEAVQVATPTGAGPGAASSPQNSPRVVDTATPSGVSQKVEGALFEAGKGGVGPKKLKPTGVVQDDFGIRYGAKPDLTKGAAKVYPSDDSTIDLTRVKASTGNSVTGKRAGSNSPLKKVAKPSGQLAASMPIGGSDTPSLGLNASGSTKNATNDSVKKPLTEKENSTAKNTSMSQEVNANLDRKMLAAEEQRLAEHQKKLDSLKVSKEPPVKQSIGEDSTIAKVLKDFQPTEVDKQGFKKKKSKENEQLADKRYDEKEQVIPHVNINKLKPDKSVKPSVLDTTDHLHEKYQASIAESEVELKKYQQEIEQQKKEAALENNKETLRKISENAALLRQERIQKIKARLAGGVVETNDYTAPPSTPRVGTKDPNKGIGG